MMKRKNVKISHLLDKQFHKASFLHALLQDQARVASQMTVCWRVRSWVLAEENKAQKDKLILFLSIWVPVITVSIVLKKKYYHFVVPEILMGGDIIY